MVLKVKNIRPLLILSITIFIFFSGLFYKFYSSSATQYDMNMLQRYEALVRDSLFSLRYTVKKSFDDIDVSDEITVVGIDGPTHKHFGKPNNFNWSARFPYDAQLKYLQKFFEPAVVSYDIMFKPTLGDTTKEDSDIIYDTDRLGAMIKTLHQYSLELASFPPEAIKEMGVFIGEKGEELLQETLSFVKEPEGSGKPLNVIMAYDISEPKTVYEENVDFNNKALYKWDEEMVLGDDPDEKTEDFGNISYLKRLSIPLENISDIPEDLVYLPGGELISESILEPVSLGYVNVRRDADGIVRRYPLVHATKYYNSIEKKLKSLFLPSMALQSILKLKGAEAKDVSIKYGEQLEIKHKDGKIIIPIDRYGRLLINFNATILDFNNLPFKDINISGARVNTVGIDKLGSNDKKIYSQIKNFLSNKIALVGLTFTGNGDEGPTALEDHTPLVYVHASVISEILKENHITQAGDGVMYGFVLLIAVIIGVGGLTLSIKDLSVFFGLLILLILSISFGGIYWNKIHFPILFLLFYTLILYVSIVLFRYTTEEKEKLKIRNMFSTMVSSTVLDYMEENPESFSLSGSKMPATIMFSDVAGFTSISEGLTPEQLVQLLNKYLTPMTDIILKSGGYVDKYEGDAIMAEWGVPYPNDKHATLACWAVIDQLKKLDEIREELYEEFGYRLTVRMGVNSGDVSAGNMGSESRFSYTVMGDAVNLAARLEPTNKVYGTYAMIGEKTYDQAKDDIETRLLDKVVVVGKKESIRVYELLARKGELPEDQIKFVAHYEKGLELHEERLWDEAIAEFNKALEINPEDYASKVLIKRIEEYKVDPPAESWKGEYVRKSKD